jgi:pyruvate/2-oxoglutarate dehydrogenase complex dihydrolipoamide dehydrogenase (E3) component
VAFDDQRVVDSDGILRLDRVPASLVVVGAGVIGIEYASIFAALGCKVTAVEKRERMLEFCDEEVVRGQDADDRVAAARASASGEHGLGPCPSRREGTVATW